MPLPRHRRTRATARLWSRWNSRRMGNIPRPQSQQRPRRSGGRGQRIYQRRELFERIGRRWSAGSKSPKVRLF